MKGQWLGVHASLLVGLAAVSLALSACAAQKPPEPHHESQERQGVWWTDGGLIKNALVAYFRLEEHHPDLEKVHDLYWNTVSLVLILDGRNDPTTLQTLADLSSYYWGESGGEMFDCVVWRKGGAIVPYLQKHLDDLPSDCRITLGDGSARCLQEAEYRGHLRGLLSSIARNESCSVER